MSSHNALFDDSLHVNEPFVQNFNFNDEMIWNPYYGFELNTLDTIVQTNAVFQKRKKNQTNVHFNFYHSRYSLKV